MSKGGRGSILFRENTTAFLHNNDHRIDEYNNRLKHKGSSLMSKGRSLNYRYNCLIEATKNLAPTILSLALVFLIILILGNSGENGQVQALNCYHCSSADNPGCDESFSGRANITETDCEKHIGKPAKVCRKLVQYIEQKKIVIRSCGHIDDHEEKDRKSICYKRSGTFALMMESCTCYEDNCNHSANLVPSFSIILILISLSLATVFSKKPSIFELSSSSSTWSTLVH